MKYKILDEVVAVRDILDKSPRIRLAYYLAMKGDVLQIDNNCQPNGRFDYWVFNVTEEGRTVFAVSEDDIEQSNTVEE